MSSLWRSFIACASSAARYATTTVRACVRASMGLAAASSAHSIDVGGGANHSLLRGEGATGAVCAGVRARPCSDSLGAVEVHVLVLHRSTRTRRSTPIVAPLNQHVMFWPAANRCTITKERSNSATQRRSSGQAQGLAAKTSTYFRGACFCKSRAPPNRSK